MCLVEIEKAPKVNGGSRFSSEHSGTYMRVRGNAAGGRFDSLVLCLILTLAACLQAS